VINAGHSQLPGDVVEVILDRIEARPAAGGDLPPAEPMPRQVEHYPFRRGEQIWVRWAAATPTSGHRTAA
jgi:hypothetical protein